MIRSSVPGYEYQVARPLGTRRSAGTEYSQSDRLEPAARGRV
jgi:hypothetical protein